MIVDDVINVNDWVNKADNKKLDQDVQQNYNEVASEMIRVKNADLPSELVSNNEIRNSIILEKITAQEERKSKKLAEKIQRDLDIFLRDDNEPFAALTEIDDSTFKKRRSKRLVESNKKIKSRSLRPYLKSKKVI